MPATPRKTRRFGGDAEHQPAMFANLVASLIAALERVLGHPVSLAVAGRTDTGVHAWAQVVSFDAHASDASGLDLDGLQRSVNKLLGPAIVVRAAAVVDNGFDARRSARSRT